MHSSVKSWPLAVAVVLAASAAGAKVLEDVVAKVNGKPLYLSEYRKNLRSVLDNFGQNLPEMLADEGSVRQIRQKVLQQMIDDEVVAQAAESRAIKVHGREIDKGIEEVQETNFRVDPSGKRRSDAEVSEALKSELAKEGLTEEQFRDRIRRQLMARKLMEEEVRSKLKEPDDDKAREAFETLRAVARGSTEAVKGLSELRGQAFLSFGTRIRDLHAERVRVAHILVKVPPNAGMVAKNKALEKAKAIKRRLAGGEDFADAAGKDSDDAESAARGGDLGPILRGWMPKPFEDAAFSLPVGQVSDPVETDFGYHLIRVQEKRAQESVQFDKLRLDIKQFLMGMEFQEKLQEFVKRLRAKATIEVQLPADN